jgi:hypothetical protein
MKKRNELFVPFFSYQGQAPHVRVDAERHAAPHAAFRTGSISMCFTWSIVSIPANISEIKPHNCTQRSQNKSVRSSSLLGIGKSLDLYKSKKREHIKS